MPSLPGGCTTEAQFSNYVHERVRECIMRYMSKEETARHLRDRYQIVYRCTERAWCNIERLNQDFFRTYFENGAPNATALAKIAKKTALAQIKEGTGSCKTPNSPPKGDSNKAPSFFSDTSSREEEQQLMEFVRNFLSQEPEEAACAHDGNPIVFVEQNSSKAGEQSQALEKPKLDETSQQQQQQQPPHYPTAEFWQKLSATLGQIESNTSHMVKLMSDGHGFAAQSSAVVSSKRQRDEQEEERGGNDETEKLQDQNIQLPQQTHGQSRGNKAAKIL
ncbi:hypothetical protein Rs2_15365 [Raphanus sativus]|uniref:Uncharacterized protein LOC108832133 isoform X1 n=1 Tax=Raphanus sativus TaxID=3726 RepID=A0A6J0LMX7_RAPSA|nr:uncharacterized protein LOC108832133 isoform X1 [Raphanus sativus]KAJ4901414.1 hypothetical protein Rs2_15365 [Raphanus sativus]